MSALDDMVKSNDDNPSIGLVLCMSKNKVIAEYALRDMAKPIGVAEYKIIESMPEHLKTSLPTIEEIEAELEENIIK